MATMVWRVTPTFSASAAWVISPAWKRSVRMVLAIFGCPLPIGSVHPVEVEPRRIFGDARQHQAEEERIGGHGRVEAEGEEQDHAETGDRGEHVGKAHAF